MENIIFCAVSECNVRLHWSTLPESVQEAIHNHLASVFSRSYRSFLLTLNTFLSVAILNLRSASLIFVKLIQWCENTCTTIYQFKYFIVTSLYTNFNVKQNLHERVLALEKTIYYNRNPGSFSNYDANLTTVITWGSNAVIFTCYVNFPVWRH